MNKCKSCSKDTTNPKFCSKSCAAKINNLGNQKNKALPRICNFCGDTYTWTTQSKSIYCNSCRYGERELNPSKLGLEDHAVLPAPAVCLYCDTKFYPKWNYITNYCSRSCGSKASGAIRSKRRVKEWLEGTWNGGKYSLSETIRTYLLERANYSCSICSFSAFHPDDNRSILEINHINGKGNDHRPSNLEVLCPNCHSLTSSYRGRNKGNGRDWIYVRKSRS
jgi:5-methylcytosine-specific restriction endonuclease McrA